MSKYRKITEAEAMASWMSSGCKRKTGEADKDVINRAIKAQQEALAPPKKTSKIGAANQEPFPYVFDLMFDIKSPSQALRKLKTLEEDVKQKKEDYKELHRMMREHGYKITLPTEIT